MLMFLLLSRVLFTATVSKTEAEAEAGFKIKGTKLHELLMLMLRS